MTQEQFRAALLEIKCDLLEKKNNRRNSRLKSSLGYLNGQIDMLNLILGFVPKQDTSEEVLTALQESVEHINEEDGSDTYSALREYVAV